LGTIEKTIARLDGVHNLVGGGIDIDFPSAISFSPENATNNPKPTCGMSAPVGLSLMVGVVTVIVSLSCSSGSLATSGYGSDICTTAFTMKTGSQMTFGRVGLT